MGQSAMGLPAAGRAHARDEISDRTDVFKFIVIQSKSFQAPVSSNGRCVFCGSEMPRCGVPMCDNNSRCHASVRVPRISLTKVSPTRHNAVVPGRLQTQTPRPFFERTSRAPVSKKTKSPQAPFSLLNSHSIS